MKPTNNKEKNINAFINSLVVGVCVTMTLLIVFTIVISSINRFQESAINSLRESKKAEFTSIINILENDANEVVSKTANYIEKNIINNEDTDLSNLKDEMGSGNYHNLSLLVEPYIINKYLNGVKTDGNTMFVATYKGMVCDFSYTNAGNMGSHTTCSYRRWKDFVSDSYNKILTKNAIEQLKNKSTDLIVWQYPNPHIEDMEMLDNVNIDDLYNIYLEYGLAGLKSYELLVPAYITEDGDIFGQKDMVQGLRYNNCKIIVVQRINLYDQINELFRDFEDEEPMNEIISKYSIIKDEIRILGLVIVIIHLSSIAHFCNMYNKKYIKTEDEN